jgi:hypothetical protein
MKNWLRLGPHWFELIRFTSVLSKVYFASHVEDRMLAILIRFRASYIGSVSSKFSRGRACPFHRTHVSNVCHINL